MTTAVQALMDAGLTGDDAVDQANINAAMSEVTVGKLPVPEFVTAFSSLYIARLLAEIDALENPPEEP